VTSVLGFFGMAARAVFSTRCYWRVMLKVRHPAPEEMEPLGRKRTIVAIITLLVFALSFVPFPISTQLSKRMINSFPTLDARLRRATNP
jgi:hypothetical protein